MVGHHANVVIRRASMVRKSPQQARSRFTVSAILEATERLVSSGQRPGTRAIARLAGVSVGTLYQYFPTAESILGAVVDDRLQRDEQSMAELLQSSELPLDEWIRHSIERVVPQQPWARALYPKLVDVLGSIGRTRAVRNTLERLELLLTRELTRRSDELREGLDPAVAASVLIHSVRAASLELGRSHPELSREDVVTELSQLAAGYLSGNGHT